MSSFTSPLIVEYLADSGLWRLVHEFAYWTRVECSTDLNHPSVTRIEGVTLIRVPAGFQTDFTSSPWFSWWLVPPTGPHGKAAVVHDYLYSEGIGTRRWADDVFYEALKVLDVPWYKRVLMYYAVRGFGRGSYS